MKLQKLFFSLIFFQLSALNLQASEKLCGKASSLVLKMNAENQFTIVEKIKLTDEYCDTPNGELNANFVLKLYDATQRVVYQKKFILEEFSHFEEIPKNAEGKITKNKVVQKGSQRILKIPFNTSTSSATKFSINKLSNESIKTEGAFKW